MWVIRILCEINSVQMYYNTKIHLAHCPLSFPLTSSLSLRPHSPYSHPLFTAMLSLHPHFPYVLALLTSSLFLWSHSPNALTLLMPLLSLGPCTPYGLALLTPSLSLQPHCPYNFIVLTTPLLCFMPPYFEKNIYMCKNFFPKKHCNVWMTQQ